MSSAKDNQIEPRLLKGFRDALPDKLLVRNKLIQDISKILENFAFLPLETPALEYAEILEGKLGNEGEKLLYRFVDHGGRNVALRYDFTVPLARVAAQYPDLTKPFKRYQVGPVWRADNTQRGRYREFYQFDMDIVGVTSIVADAEILVLIQEILLALGIKNFKIKVNDRNFLTAVAKQAKLNNEQSSIFFTGLDKLDKTSAEQVIEYWVKGGLSGEQVRVLESATLPSDDKTLPVYGDSDSSMQLNFDDSKLALTQVINKAKELGLKQECVELSHSIVRGLDYYTGIVFETILTDAPEFGSVFSGGRYDGLIGRFSKQDIPAVGASVGLDRLLAAMEFLQLAPKLATTTQVFVTLFNAELSAASLQIAQELRQNNINTEVSYQVGDLGKQIKLAATKGVSHAIIVGPDESENNHLILRNLESGQEQKLTTAQAIEYLKNR